MGESCGGNLLIIGGNEDKQGECIILRKFIAMAGGRESRIAVVTTATEFPREVGDEYRSLFTEFGAESSNILFIANREAANDRHNISEIEQSSGIFFTGGDQLRLTSILGGSGVDAAIRRSFRQGTVIAGTSAGASVMSDTMIVDGSSSDTPTKSMLSMAHGMGLLEEVVIDQHFAQRGRINRLLAAVAQNPHILGVGIDEDTALSVSPEGMVEIVGSQTVTIVDGKSIIQTNISESKPFDPLALTNVILHILPSGFGYDLKRRVPHTSKTK
ncbi:MAG TPA: cyanophycinase [Selenomonadales bacterium]|nr:cyanophycinase [Selenomonadales bacterium]